MPTIEAREASRLRSEGNSLTSIARLLFPGLPKSTGIDKVKELLEAYGGYIRESVSPSLSQSYSGIPSSWYKNEQDRPTVIPIPDSPCPDMDDFLRLSGNYGIISDLHIPYHSSRVITHFLDNCNQFGLEEIIIAGDWMDGGQWHPKRGKNQQHHRDFQEDTDLAKRVIEAILTHGVKRMYLVMGNHDAWFETHMRGQVDHEWLLDNLFHEFGDSVTFSSFEQCRVTSGGKEFSIVHGANYCGTNPMSIAKRLSDKFDSGIVMGHQHLHCTGRSYNGKHQIVCMGGAYDIKKLGYIHKSPRNTPTMTTGYALLKDGWLVGIDTT